MYGGFRRKAARPQGAPASQRVLAKQFPAPTRGLVINENQALASPLSARRMDNWFPELEGCRVRLGSYRHATIGSDPVESLFSYRSGLGSVLFAADAGNVYDVTTPEDRMEAPTPVITGQTSGYYTAVAFSTAGGNFLYILNGTDEAQLYDGTSWEAINAMSDPVAITGVSTDLLIQGWVYRNRLFFVERRSMNVHFLPVGSIGGALSTITLHGTFRRGGSILFGATWSLDSGDGMDDKCVIVSTEGEIAVFEGYNPAGSTPGEWNLVGVYDCARPLGKNGHMRIGGDLLILTDEGIIPLTAIMSKDPAALALAAISRAIEPAWRQEVQRRRALPWEIIKWTDRNMAVVSLPRPSASDPAQCFVVNLQSGAWGGPYTGWDTRCLHVFDGWSYFGTNNGRVMMMEVGGTDDGSPYECVLVSHYDHLEAPGTHKAVQQMRAVFVAERQFNPLMSASVDYVENLPAPPSSIQQFTADVWDVGLWDEAVWDAAGASFPVHNWNTVGRSGFAVAWQMQVTSGTDLALVAELKAVDITFETGGLVV